MQGMPSFGASGGAAGGGGQGGGQLAFLRQNQQFQVRHTADTVPISFDYTRLCRLLLRSEAAPSRHSPMRPSS
jgi:hypothetical protein